MAGAHKITPSSPRLATLLADVQRGNIKIPVFQRQFVWTDEQIMSLLDSIYMGYPVGSILLWSTKTPLNYDRNVGGFRLPRTPEDYPVNYVLDGQQRLTTLYGVFNSSDETDDAELADRFSVVFLPEDGLFAHHSVVEDGVGINMKAILDTTKLLPELSKFDNENQKKIAELTERFKDYEFPIVTIKDRTNQEVCRIFQRINSSGTSLSTLELLAAWTWSDQFDLRNEIEDLLDRLADKGYAELDESLLMRCLSAIVLRGIDSDALVDKQPADLIRGMTRLKEAVYSVIDFLEKELSIKNIVFVPFPIMIVPLVSFYAQRSKPSADQISALRRWFWHCAFTQRYKAGTNKMVLQDLESMRKLAEGTSAFENLDAVVDQSLFRKSWRINSAAAKATICLMAQYHPRSLLCGNMVDLGTALAAYNAREFHHIYPKGYLAKKGMSFHEANVIANICFIASGDNKEISDRCPSEYFQDIPAKIKAEVLSSALIPEEVGDGTKLYSDFLDLRVASLATAASGLIRLGRLP